MSRCSSLASMLSSQVDLGQALFLQPKTGTQLSTQATAHISTESPNVHGPIIPFSSLLDGTHWIRAGPMFTISFTVSFVDNVSFPSHLQAAFLQQFTNALVRAQVRTLFSNWGKFY